jgi:DNA-binding LacI/PurR family transcriptional regulator
MLPAGRPAANGRSLAESLAQQLAAAIAGGKVQIGELLPPERELARRHRVGRVTVRGALGQLVAAGMIESRPGVGHVVVRERALVNDTRPVGLIYRDLAAFGSGTSKSVPAIESELASRGRALLIASSGVTAEREDDCVRRFRAAGAGALVVSPATTGPRSRELELWIRQGMPLVLEGHPGRWLLPDRLALRCDRVDVDNRGGVLGALEFLKGLGHRDVGFLLPGSPEHSERFGGFVDGVREFGLRTREAWTVTGVADARAGVARLKGEGRLPTAMVCSDDNTALAFIRAAREGGLECPADISVVGFGNESVEGPMAIAELTTVDHSREELAREILRLLEAQINEERNGGEEVRLPTRLLVRGSCAAPRVARRS